MARIKKKFIRFGTGSEDVNSRVLPANYTPTNYSPSQVASEGTDKVSAHLKGINDALATAGGSAGDIGQTSFSAANNQASAANVTSLAFANGVVRSFEALVSVHIDATSDLMEQFILNGIQKSGSWEMTVQSRGDTSGVAFSITSGGQVQYTSTNVSGFVSNTIKFRAIVTGV
jgi:hypothetical protein